MTLGDSPSFGRHTTRRDHPDDTRDSAANEAAEIV
jgi:hypothetical protein